MENKKTSIAIGGDHAGFEYKAELIKFLKDYEVKDFGAYSAETVDYPDFAHPVALAVENKEYNVGILLCGSANGVAISANKHQGIRAALCWNEDVAKFARLHNDANIICIPARFVSLELAKQMVTLFLNTAFEGGRHADRVNKISC